MTAGHKYEICSAECNSETHILVVENQDGPGKGYHFDWMESSVFTRNPHWFLLSDRFLHLQMAKNPSSEMTPSC